MNRLDLVQRLVAESGMNGLAIASTLNQKGDSRNFVDWIDDAWLEIQGLHNWPSLWEQATVTIAAGQSTVAGALPHHRYVKDSARLAGVDLEYFPWDRFRLTFPQIRPGIPSAWSIRPDRSVAVNTQVEADTSFQVERYRLPGRFTQNSDVPSLFAEHHMMIVWRGLVLYGGFDEAGVAYKRGSTEYERMKRLAAQDLPVLEPGEPLA